MLKHVTTAAVIATLAAQPSCGDRKKKSPTTAEPGRTLVPAPNGTAETAPVARRYVGSTSAYFPRRVELAAIGAADEKLSVSQSVLPITGTDLAVLSSVDSNGPRVELVDMAAARTVWHDKQICGAPAVYADAGHVLCASWSKVRALRVSDGTVAWENEQKFAAALEGYAFLYRVGPVNKATLVDIETGLGKQLAVSSFDATTVIAACRQGEEVRFFTHQTGQPVIAWDVVGNRMRERSRYPELEIERADLCAKPALIEVPRDDGSELLAVDFSKKTARLLGRVVDVDGWWLARRNGFVETTTDRKLSVRDRALKEIEVLHADVPPSTLLASRGERRLLRMRSDDSLVLLDESGRTTWFGAPARASSFAMNDNRIFAAGWLPPHSSHRVDPTLFEFDLDAAPRGVPRAPLDPEPALGLREPTIERSEAKAPVVLAGAEQSLCTATESFGGRVFVATINDGKAGVAMFDGSQRVWPWSRLGAFGDKTRIGSIAATADVVVAAVRAISDQSGAHAFSAATGEPLWKTSITAADAVQAAGDVVAVFHGDHVSFLSIADGSLLYRVRSVDGYRPHAAVVLGSDGRTYTLTIEADGSLVQRDAANRGAPGWTIGIRGRIRRISPLAGAAAVELTSGEMIGVQIPGGRVRTLPLRNPLWHATGTNIIVRDSPAAGGLRALVAFDELGQPGPSVALELSAGARLVPTADAGWLFYEGGARRVTRVDAAAGTARRTALPRHIRRREVAGVPGGGVAISSKPVAAHRL